MKDGNNSLQIIVIHIYLRDDDSYMDIEVKEDKTPAIDGTEIFTFTTETLPLADEKLLNILSINQDSIFPELLAYFKEIGIFPQGG